MLPYHHLLLMLLSLSVIWYDITGAETKHHFLDELYKMMVKDAYDGMKKRGSKVVEFKHPKELEAMLDLALKKQTSDDRLLEICKDVIKYSVKTGTYITYLYTVEPR
jgi:hypothetical protein